MARCREAAGNGTDSDLRVPPHPRWREGTARGSDERGPGFRAAGEGARAEQQEKRADQVGSLRVPDGPGGVTPVEAAIKEARMPGEPWWD